MRRVTITFEQICVKTHRVCAILCVKTLYLSNHTEICVIPKIICNAFIYLKKMCGYGMAATISHLILIEGQSKSGLFEFFNRSYMTHDI
jgi:hypothetical protein